MLFIQNKQNFGQNMDKEVFSNIKFMFVSSTFKCLVEQALLKYQSVLH